MKKENMKFKQILLLSTELSIASCRNFFLPEPIIPNVVDERKDIIASINLNDYSIGSKFAYSGAIQNNTSNDIIIDNSNKNSLEYLLIKDETEVEKISLQEDLRIVLKELGYIEVTHELDKMKFSISNASVTYAGKTYEIPAPLKFSKTMDMPNMIFNESGVYEVQLKVKYSVEGTEYESAFKTGEFEVKNE
jgi:secreted protein with Ig-like and vWFA domain